MKRAYFKCGIGEDGNHYIYSPDGLPVLQYQFLSIGRMGATREYNIWLPDETGKFLRNTVATLRYLNGGELLDWESYELSGETLEYLDSLRERYKARSRSLPRAA